MTTAADIGAVADGQSHKLGTRYTTLDAARNDYPAAQSLDDEIDGCALQQLWDADGVYLPPGSYVINRTLTLNDRAGQRLEGAGPATRINYWGPAGEPAVRLTDCDSCQFRRFWLTSNGNVNAPKGYGVQIWNVPGQGANISTQLYFEDVVLGGPHQGAFTDCWSVDSGGGTSNSELHRWKRCYAFGYVRSGWRIHHSQAHGLVWEDCVMNGLGHPGTYGVYGEYGGGGHWLRGSGGYNANWDFFWSSPFNPVSVQDWNSENSAGLFFLQAGGTSCCAYLRGCRFETDRAPDGSHFIQVFSNGVARIAGNTFNLADRQAWVSLGSYEGTGAVVHEFRGNVIRSVRRYEEGCVKLSHAGMRCVQAANLYGHPAGGEWYEAGPAADTPGLSEPNYFSAPNTFDAGLAALADATLLRNRYDGDKGLAFESVHNDGRMRVKASGAPGGMVFWGHAHAPIQFEQPVQFAPGAAVVLPNPFLGAAGTSTGDTGYCVGREADRLLFYASRVGTPPEQQPVAELCGRQVVLRGGAPASGGGVEGLRVDADGRVWVRCSDNVMRQLDVQPTEPQGAGP
jgi:hypothetical protein